MSILSVPEGKMKIKNMIKKAFEMDVYDPSPTSMIFVVGFFCDLNSFFFVIICPLGTISNLKERKRIHINIYPYIYF